MCRVGRKPALAGAVALLQARFGAASEASVRKAADLLADVPRLAVEIDIASPDRPLAVHQFLLRGEPVPEAVTASGFAGFQALWQPRDTPFGRWADTCFLETDLDGTGAPTGASVFFRGSPEAAADRSAAIHAASVAAFGPEKAGWIAGALDGIEPHLPVGARVSAFGWMIGRTGNCRVNVVGVPFGALPAFAAAVDLDDVPAEAATVFDLAVDAFDKVTLALDLILDAGGPATLRLSGFECFVDEAFGADQRWLGFARAAARYCGTDDAALSKLLSGFCRVLPGDAAARWPDAWLVHALTAPPGDVPVARARLSHVKVQPVADGRWRTKAYLAAERIRHATPAPRPSAGTPVPDARAARDAGIRFLLQRQDQAGLWRDFAEPGGASDEWAAAVIAYCLADTGAEGRIAAERAYDALLRRQRPEGGWGYNAATPHDADSTAWMLHLARRLGRDGAAERTALRFLRSHLLEGGGVGSYAGSTRFGITGPLGLQGVDGFKAAHACVATAAAAFLGDETRRFLAGAQADDGSLPGYWWSEASYPTAAALLLGGASLGVDGPGIDAGRAAAWLAWIPAAGITCFAAGLRLAALASIRAAGGAGHLKAAALLADRLVGAQRTDGGWDGDSCMWFPHPSDTLPVPSEGKPLPDVRGLFTTAAAVLGLDLFVRCGAP